jgi:cyclomaltodextrinase / maltogenic alpha-amylase / neopullulanase
MYSGATIATQGSRLKQHWANDSIFYHIYPLGFCGAPRQNDFASPAMPRLEQLYGWLDHLQRLQINALYLGPVFESTAHGYDTVDYYRVDRRLGDNDTLRQLVSALHRRGIRVVLDGVFNHVGRDFWALRDVRSNGPASPYCDWFRGLAFDKSSPYNDPFGYEAWNGCYDLVRLNLENPAVKEHLLHAVETWIQEYDIDGLRLDAADCVDLAFLKELASLSRSRRPDFWLMGEIIHGDYRKWANAETLDSVTNYECYKGLYSSFVDKNLFEIAYTLNRQFGEEGIYRGLPLYAFADNHDVNRVASNLKIPAHLYPLYCLLFTMPGVPSIYYGSEWGITGTRTKEDDTPLRPHIDLTGLSRTSPHPSLVGAISRLAQIRRATPALRDGEYRQLFVAHEQLAFARQTIDETIIVIINASQKPVPIELKIPLNGPRNLVDLLNPDSRHQARHGLVRIDAVPSCWARILKIT